MGFYHPKGKKVPKEEQRTQRNPYLGESDRFVVEVKEIRLVFLPTPLFFPLEILRGLLTSGPEKLDQLRLAQLNIEEQERAFKKDPASLRVF